MTDAGRARTMVASAKTATLSTIATKPAGFPFGSLVAIATDLRGRPLLLLSALAEHSKNLARSPLASILVAEGGLASPRVTLLGRCEKIAEDEVVGARSIYLDAHPDAAQWASFADFALYRLEVSDVRLVAGFGKMSWIKSEDYRAASA